MLRKYGVFNNALYLFGDTTSNQTHEKPKQRKPKFSHSNKLKQKAKS